MPEWSAAQYSKFTQERTLPAVDLANSIKCENVNSVLDIGCGIENSTAVLARRFPGAEIIGAIIFRFPRLFFAAKKVTF